MEQIEKLKEEIEIKFGKKIESPSNFDALFLAIKKKPAMRLVWLSKIQEKVILNLKNL